MKLSGPVLLFVGFWEGFLYYCSNVFLVIGLFKFSVSSWFSLRSYMFLDSSWLSNLLAYTCSQHSFFKRFNLFRESGREVEREGEKHQCVVAWN